ncbi:glycoside hydrolase family 25 protein [Rhodococcus sp. G-MC3]|uniref:glycoside hydrolase family 25 protein n=1 Tax=Rhodococcus sp. G-MC3 TaxID=3046209 RepID=UPI0024B9BD0F|nr:glycoside hydrolase family 25 protein [Rhodococcus sp. G-MC3]MDJ0395651.1 glycoside hydrolase family 25 protein [Rhodococcus sp. G-MC3]
MDVSNHQGNFDFAAARREGFAFAVHKISEGDGYRDPYWPWARVEMAQYFPKRWGGYVFCRTDVDPAREAQLLREHAGGIDFPLQIDYEDTTNGGSVDDLLSRIDAYRAVGFEHFLPVYIPRWFWETRMAGGALDRLPVGVWNSDYVGGRDYASRLYPGDDWAPSRGADRGGWADMGGKPVRLLQFSESAVVAGQSIDANAFRGNESQLDSLFEVSHEEGEMTDESAAIAAQLLGSDGRGFEILGRAVETDPSRDRFLTEAVAVILTQLAGGPNFEGWEQLGDGADSAAPRRTLVDALAHIKKQNDEILELLRRIRE